MSDFHEYVTETASASDGWRASFRARVHEHVRARDHAAGTHGVAVVEWAQVKDVIYASRMGRVQERARVRDIASAATLRVASVHERVRACDSHAGATRGAVTLERVRAKESVRSGFSAFVAEVAVCRDAISGVAIGVRVTDGVRVRDGVHGAICQRTAERARIRDAISGQLKVVARTTERARARDAVSGKLDVVTRTVDRARASDGSRVQYSAQARTAEVVFVADRMHGAALDAPVQGYAWTAPVQGWAMSRYDRYPLSGPVMVDGVAYASAHDGVYALAGGDEVIHARLVTGKMDVGRGVLARPIYAYLEYEQDGLAAMTVRQTQSGQAQESWTYPLEAEPADCLTNGRFIFGRGLRGRHFSFELQLSGRRAHLDDLYVVAEATRRRV
ncbi:hypothetical protein EII18_08395 [Comamonadaceae bacterium OH3737_COT-264]|nr:hypothetical protein EII18_08395 [Comamonadaceae bacterium OH3737_COT-264]